ncbi:MAG: type II toxin-antitoxin system VapC family toxin [Alphaproteobacteria bacterium]|nr:type II toxin-antitoxin system VapC family toxin [Alphaproteobacteria bacterium]
MKLLLDSHAFIWWIAGSTRLSQPARRAIETSTNPVIVSVASIWEISIKRQLGRLHRDEFNHDSPTAAAQLQEFEILPIGSRHAQVAATQPSYHTDPFDRLLIAQAQIEGMTLVSNERVFDRYRVQRLW